MHRLTIVFLFIFLRTHLCAQEPKAYYVGHSLTDYIPEMVQSLSDNHNEVNFSWIFQSIPGAPLRWQWDRKAAMDFTNYPPHIAAFYNESYGLPTGDFDALILTESVPRYLT